MRPEDANQQSAPQCGTREGRRAPVRLFQVQGASVVQHVLLGYNVFGYLSIYSGCPKNDLKPCFERELIERKAGTLWRFPPQA